MQSSILLSEAKKRARRGNHARHLSLSLPCVQQTSHPTVSCQHTDLSPSVRVCVSAFACARAYMIYRGNMRGCASLAVCACPLCCMISHWSVHGGAADTSDPAADQTHQRPVPLWPARGGLISTRLCSVDRKNKRGDAGGVGGGIGRNTETGRRSGDERVCKEASVEHMTGIQKRKNKKAPCSDELIVWLSVSSLM